MKISEIVLVTENIKGTEINYLLTYEDYKAVLLDSGKLDQTELMDVVMELAKSLVDYTFWNVVYWAPNKTMHARYCADMNQLRSFLYGYQNSPEQDWRFDEERSSKQCIKTLKAIGIHTNGRGAGILHSYAPVQHWFQHGELIHNFNGSDYRVLEALAPDNYVLMDNETCDFVLAFGLRMYCRHPLGEQPSKDNTVYGVEWGHGVYLSGVLSAIDFKDIKNRYGEKKESLTLEEYREELTEKFKLYYKLLGNDLISDTLGEAVSKSMYEEFGTGREEVFLDNLKNGNYDGNYVERQGRSR